MERTVLVAQSRPTLCNPMDSSHPFMGFSIQASPFMGFSGQAHWSGLPFPSPGDLPTQGSNLGLPGCRHTLYQLSHQGSALLVPGAEQTDWSGSRGGTRRFTRVSFNFFWRLSEFSRTSTMYSTFNQKKRVRMKEGTRGQVEAARSLT